MIVHDESLDEPSELREERSLACLPVPTAIFPPTKRLMFNPLNVWKSCAAEKNVPLLTLPASHAGGVSG